MKSKITVFRPFIPEQAIENVAEVLRSGWVGEGPKVRDFEDLLAKRIGIKHVVTVNNGTSAIRLALALAGVGYRDEVITPAATSQATNTPILEQFARPVFADVKYQSCTLDPADIEHRITARTRAIICVDWGGYPGDLQEIGKMARENDLHYIEDAAHAMGATYHGKQVGSISELTAFSFQAIKHMTTGDGGMLTVRSSKLFQKARRLRWYGIDRDNRKYTVLGVDPTFDIREAGYKCHMNDLSAAIGIAQMEFLDQNLERRARIARRYREELSGAMGIELFENESDRTSANWLFCIHVKKRLGFARHMVANGIEVSVVNWRNDKYTIFGGMRKDLPNTDRLHRDMIAIPLHPYLSDDDVSYVIQTIRDASWLK